MLPESVSCQMPIAIVGVSALFPGSSDASGFWRDILSGRDLLTDVPSSHWRIEDYYDADPNAPDKTYAKRGGFLSPIDFDALGWGIPPSTLPATDTAQLLALVVAQAVLEDAAREGFATMDRSRISVILGVTSAQELLFSMVSRLQRPVWVKALRETGLPENEVQAACERIAANYVPWQEASFPGLLGNVVAGRIANRLNLGGTNCVTDAACASTFSALSMAVNELALGQSDLAIAGGVDTLNDIFMYMCFSKTPALSPSGDCRPFSDQADGTMLGEGLGMVALKRLSDAERDGDRIYAVLRGIGTGSDGRAKSVYAPVAAGQARALARAYDNAGYSAATVELVEAHGTGTKAGDAAEFEGLKMVFGAGDDVRKQWCALGSVKSQIGHTKAAAGAAGLFKAVMALHHKVLPPSIKISAPNPKLEIENSPFYLNTMARPWIRGSQHPRRASVSAFGFGGANFHVTLEEYLGHAPAALRLPTQRQELVLLAANSAAALLTAIDELAQNPLPLVHLAAHSRQSWVNHSAYRLALVAANLEQLQQGMQSARDRIRAQPEQGFELAGHTAYGCGPSAGQTALIFPGQGSQYLGMGSALAMQFDAARAVWDAAADEPFDPTLTLHEVMFPRPGFNPAARAAHAERLTATEWAQPAIGAHSAALLAQLQQLDIHADVCAGHSFGEIMALHAARCFDAKTALQIARQRGVLMRDAGTVAGAMCALKLPLEEVRALLAQHAPELVIANHNAPSQVVISGERTAMQAFEPILRAQRIDFIPLPVAAAFHSPLVAGCAGQFAAALEPVGIAAPTLPVFSNQADQWPPSPALIRSRLAAQIGEPVHFVAMIEAMYQSGVRTFVEVGPGAVLTGLVGAILGQRPHTALPLDRKNADGVETLLTALARLAALGISMRPERLFANTRLPSLPSTNTQLSVAISGSNLGKPYPPQDLSTLPPPNPPRPLAAPAAPVIAAATGTDSMTTTTLPSDAWLLAFQESQQHAAAAHETFQRTMAQSHAAYLKLAESALLGLSGGRSDSAITAAEPPLIAVKLPAPSTHVATTLAPIVAPVVAAAPRALTPIAPAAATPAAPDIATLLLDIVAEKTGYPVAMLTLDMDLEGDLGIDSIKRVEILAAVDERAPQLAHADRAKLGALHTLREILIALAPESSPAKTIAPAPAVSALEPLLLAIVAEKTGYPVAMLKLDMDLEGDLGIDSIKRVEILAAVDERAPQLPKVDRARLSALHTLREILTYLQNDTALPTPPSAAIASTTPTPKLQTAALGRYVLELIPAPATGLALAGLRCGHPVVVIGEDTIGPLLVAELRDRGVAAVSAAALPPGSTACIDLRGLRPALQVADAIAVNYLVFQTARSLAPQLKQAAGLFVTVQDTGGSFSLRAAPEYSAWSAGLPALVKTCALEWPQASVKAIDLECAGRTPAQLAAAIAAELCEGGGEIEVALPSAGGRFTLKSVQQPARDGDAVIQANEVVVISGGARGVTAACVLRWAQDCPARFVLLGRTPLEAEPPECNGVSDETELKRVLLAAAAAAGEVLSPIGLKARLQQVLAQREIRQTLAGLIKAGAQARYDAVAIEDGEELARVLHDVRQHWGPISGIVHAAGVIADKRIGEKTDAQYRSVFDTKVEGLRQLLRATQDDPIKLLCVFSSVSARCGNTGQADYAMANEVLAKVAWTHARAHPRMRVKSLGWGPWEGGMVSPALRDRFAALGVPMIPLDAGAQMFVEEMADASSNGVELVLGGAPRAEALLMDGAQQRVDALDIHVQRGSHGYLEGHSIAGTPIVPMVLVAEWMTRAARSLRPGLDCVALHDLKVLKGIRLDGFENGGDQLRIEARAQPLPEGCELLLTVLDHSGRSRYSARAELRMQTPRAAQPLPPMQLEAWLGDSPYPAQLFHRGHFEVIEQLQGISDEGARASVQGVAAAGWPKQHWQLDVAALDGGMQLAVLYGQRMLGGSNLPTAIASLRRFADATDQGPISVSAHRRAISRSATTIDLYFDDANGQRLAELLGVQNHALASA